jgi:hypothetical protein
MLGALLEGKKKSERERERNTEKKLAMLANLLGLAL